MSVQQYLDTVRAKYATGDATEHSYRAALEALFEGVADGLTAINEPRRVACGAPDFVIKRGGIDIGHCEAKDLHIDLAKLKDANADQKKRYLKALPNLIYTNGLDFEFYKSGEKVRSISIGSLSGNKVVAHPDEFDTLSNQLSAFAAERPQSITTAKKLAEMMAGKAVLIKDIMGNALRTDAHLQTELTGQFAAFKAHLIHDIDADEFADVYAETIAYGLFAARLHDKSLDSFDRREALELLPKSNPFLRSLFGYIAGQDLDDRIAWVIDELCDVLRACNVHELMADFGKWTARNDPFLHFYETFLAEYNPAKRKSRGVWYTPEPVVNFIVRAVDDVLKTEFGLPMGLADTSKISVDWDTGQVDAKGNRTSIKKDVHRVQILDPATGTGTFLAEAIKQIAARVKGVAPGMWSQYVEQDLIPRIHGFELLMASYAMCHMKIDMMLRELDYVPSAAPPRLSVYLTNSLEEGAKVERTFDFAGAIAREGRLANEIKTDMPIMCVIGNPPYSGESANKGDWIMGLMEAYKMEPGGNVRLQERNPKWINDDYVKFIRFAEHMIAKNGEGVLGFITNHGYLDNPTFRGMRWHLLKTFDKIYVLDLHGNAKKKEVSPDGSPDKNVFDIQQGVAIVIGVKLRSSEARKLGSSEARKLGSSEARKLGSSDELAELRHNECWGARESKYEAIWSSDLSIANWTTLLPRAPHFAFVERDQAIEHRWLKGFPVNELMPVNSVGVVTARDALTIDIDRDAVWKRVRAFPSRDDEALREQFELGPDARDWKVSFAKADIGAFPNSEMLRLLNYRPFDSRWTYYTGKTKGFYSYPRYEVMRHLLQPNLGLMISRQAVQGDAGYSQVIAVDQIIDNRAIFSNKGIAQVLPLYLYADPKQPVYTETGHLDESVRVNFDPKIYAAIRAAAGLSQSSPERGGGSPLGLTEGPVPPRRIDAVENDPSTTRQGASGPPPRSGEDLGDELRVFDYIYGVLHSPDYRRTYAQFLKIDFPRIPYPASPAVFAHVADKGGQLRRLHLMEDAAIGDTPYPFVGPEDGSGDGVVGKVVFLSSPHVGEDKGGGPAASAAEKTAPLPEGQSLSAADAAGPHPNPPHKGEGRVYINADQYFDAVPETAWAFHIGGYQPAQKWLKDRKGRALTFDDVRHYQRIIKILVETDRIMKEIVLPLD